MTITWNDALRCRRSDAHLRNFARSGGRTLSGREQRVFSDAGFWAVEKAEIVVNTRERAAAYRAMIARLRQGEDVLVPLCDLYKPRGARSPAASVQIAAAAALRATQIAIAATEVDVTAGSYFSIGDRLYLVTRIVAGPAAPAFVNPVATDTPFVDDEPWTDAVVASAVYTLDILPPLRAAAPAGTALSFSDLKLRCVVQELADGDLALDLGRVGRPSLTFIESI